MLSRTVQLRRATLTFSGDQHLVLPAPALIYPFSRCIDRMSRLFFLFSWMAAWFGAAEAAQSKLVAGKAFDRFITIWLENQVRSAVVDPPVLRYLNANSRFLLLRRTLPKSLSTRASRT